MKKLIITLAIGLIALSMFANHFEPAWMFEFPQNPYLAMNIFVYGGQVFGVDLGAGDEIGIFDGDTCVGAALLTQPIADYEYGCVPINVSMVGGGVPGSATPGNFIYFRIWKSSKGVEYAYPEMSVQFENFPAYQTEFEIQGTCFVTMLSYMTPTGEVTQVVTPPAGPAGGNVTVDLSAAGVIIHEIYVLAGGGGNVTGYSFNTPSLDISFTGTPPLNSSPYGWVIDISDINTADLETYPATVYFDIADLPGVLNPGTVTLYKRDIHGTGPFNLVSATWDGDYLVATVTSFSEFILGGGTDNPLPIELSSFNAILTSEYFVNLVWVTETETQMNGFNVYRSETANVTNALLMTPVIIPATNTSTTQTYTFLDEDVVSTHTYYYWLESVDLNGSTNLHGPVSITITGGGIPDIPEIVLNNDIFVYPNPMGRSGKIKVYVKDNDYGKVSIYNSKGQLVKTLEAGPGSHTYTWDSSGVASGIYFYKLITNKDKIAKKLIIVK